MKTPSGATLDAKRLLLLIGCLVAGVVFWDFKFLWPLKMLVVMIHETGHAVTALIVGGRVENVTIAANQSGQCLSAIPDGFFAKVAVYSAGYIGSAIVGGLLLVLTFRFGVRRLVLGAACAWLSVMALLYAGDAFTGLFCVGTAVVLGLCAKFLPEDAVEALNLFLAAFSSLYVAMDLKDDLLNSAVRGQSDAGLLSNVTVVPAIVWALAWTLFSVAILAGAVWLSVNGRRKARAPAGAAARAV